MVFRGRSPEWAQRDIPKSSVVRRSSCSARRIGCFSVSEFDGLTIELEGRKVVIDDGHDTLDGQEGTPVIWNGYSQNPSRSKSLHRSVVSALVVDSQHRNTSLVDISGLFDDLDLL